MTVPVCQSRLDDLSPPPDADRPQQSASPSSTVQPVAEIFSEHTQAEWVEAFQDLEVCLEPVGGFEQMLAHPQVRHRGLVLEAGESDDGREVGIATPLPFASRELLPPPALGEHTEEVLRQAGFDEAEIENLSTLGVIRL